jgi:hypothetical protein
MASASPFNSARQLIRNSKLCCVVSILQGIIEELECTFILLLMYSTACPISDFLQYAQRRSYRTHKRATSRRIHGLQRSAQMLTCVANAADATLVPERRAWPVVMPNQPTHKKRAPTAATGRLCLPLPRRLRGPTHAAAIKAENPTATFRARLPAHRTIYRSEKTQRISLLADKTECATQHGSSGLHRLHQAVCQANGSSCA